MTPVSILALLVALLGAVKIVVIFIRPESWLSVAKKVYEKPVITMAVGLIAAAIILKFLLVEITIVQIFAAMSFMMAVMLIGAAAYGEEIIKLAEKLLKKKDVMKKAWLSMAVWIILTIWVLLALFVY